MCDAETGEFSCLRGGACCLFVLETLHVTPADLQRWRREGRTDILQELGGISYLGLQEGEGQASQTIGKTLFCPFLRYEGRQARCQIQETKPEACRRYRCGERSSPTRLRVDRNPENCYDKTMETLREKWLAYLQDRTQEEHKIHLILLMGGKWAQPGEFAPEALPRLQLQQKGEWEGEKCLHTTAELKRYLIWGWL